MTDARDGISTTVAEDTQQILAAKVANSIAAARTWNVAEMHGNMGGGTHLYRVSGGDDGSKWSYVVKIFDVPGDGPLSGGLDPNAWHYWRREWLVYRAPWFKTLCGAFRPPVCLGSGEGPDGRLWVALEDHARHDDRPWPLDRFGVVSRHIGEFNATFLDERTRPADQWLTRNFVQGWTERSGPELAQLPYLLGNPIVDKIYTPSNVEDLLHVWDRRDSFYRILNDLQQTLCHLDTNGRNVFAVADDHTVAIDWSYAGIAPLGQDLAGLVGGSLLLLEAPFALAEELESICLRNYVTGLRVGGWNGSERDVELGYLIALVLRLGIGPVGPVLTVALNEDLREYAEAAFGHPVEEFTKSVSRLAAFTLKRMDRIRDMVDV